MTVARITKATRNQTTTRSGLARVVVVALVSCVALIGIGTSGASAASTKLVGTFKIAPGKGAGAKVTGSYFRMLTPGAKLNKGPYVSNANSKAKDKTYTLFTPGTAGGLSTVAYQPAPNPSFDKNGNALAKRIVKPLSFFGKNFSVSTQKKDPQTAKAVPLPTITFDGKGHLTGNLKAFGVWWSNSTFNQGSPKPNGAKPGLTAGPTGTYNKKTHAYTLNWTSQIVGGTFNGFTGQWHFEGKFVPKS
jgi:hypothetical protein